MAEPHSTAAAVLAGQAAVIPAVGIVAALGVPLDLLGWAMFGGLVALANTEPRQPPKEGLRLAFSIALRLFIAAGVGGAFAPIGSEAAISLATFAHITLEQGAVMLRASAITLGFATCFLPEAMRLIRAKMSSMAGAQT